MMLPSAAHHAFATLASEGSEHSEHDPVLPFITGGGALLALLLLLWITTRFNRDR
ncbi:hypothetical protein HCC61_02185 [Streptomyces sp. HNM0575]|uniref:hypothetical protein n=1 Tax=Streptomyces sp. HNM0575 TaxID=2716338 RepID=UPI00145FCB9B|nr:hypothetical protein [Streptomyces sp. HNM0575]NLU71510.1 hypothetical protein [Streptomyces sp. HNM0575]